MNETRPLESVRDVMANMVSYLPALLAGLLVLVVGLIVSWIVAKLIVRLLVLLRLDRVLARLDWGRALQKGDVRHSLFDLIGTLGGVLLFLVFLENAVLLWKLTVFAELLHRSVLLIPQLVVAGIVLLIGWSVAVAVSRAVQRTLYQEEFERARIVARVVRAGILIIAVAIALVELRIAVPLVTGTFLIAFGALALGFVLAFGLGSKGAVERMWEDHFHRRKEKRERESDKPEAR